jgi:hypothetical protein
MCLADHASSRERTDFLAWAWARILHFFHDYKGGTAVEFRREPEYVFRPRAVVLVYWVLLVVGWIAPVRTLAEETAPPVATPVHVTYISGDSIYIDAGANRGLREGKVLDVVREGETVATLLIQTLSSKRAVGSLVGEPVEILIGDEVRWADQDGHSPIESIRISHLDETSIYLDAGKNRGLLGGERLSVIRDDAFVAAIQVTDVTNATATATVIESSGRPAPGDRIRLAVDADTASFGAQELVTDEPVKNRRPRFRRRDRIVRGRVGLQFLQFNDEMSSSTGFSQPALSFRVNANGMGRGRLDLAVDTRARRTYRTTLGAAGELENQTRVYRLAASIHDKRSRHVLVAGRQFAPAIATVGVFDGVLASLDREHTSLGLFSGSQPDPIDYGYSTALSEHGAYLQFHNRPEAKRRWSVTTGVVGSYFSGVINREFAYFQLLANGRRGSIYATQEMDYNRDWKLVAGEDEYLLTSSYVNLGYRFGKAFTLRLGHDDRRNIRLYRDLITPETDFDDRFRTGTWVGFTQRIKKFRFGMDAKRTDVENTEPADTYTLSLGLNRLSSKNMSLAYRGTRYQNEFTEGNLHSLNISMAMVRWARLVLTGGVRDEANLLAPALDGEVVWYGFEVDFTIGRQWFLQLSIERTDGDFVQSNQSYLSTTFRF